MSFQTVPLTRQVSLPAGLILEGEKLVRVKEGTLLSRPGAQQHIYLLREQLSGILGSLIHGIRTRKEAGRKKRKGAALAFAGSRPEDCLFHTPTV